MPFEPITPPGSAPPIAPYSYGAKAGRVVYTAGIVAMSEDGKTVGVGDVRAQTRHVLDAIARVIEAAGGSLRDVAFNHVFLASYDDYAAMNEVYREYFPDPAPPRYCIRADLVRPEFLVEIASVRSEEHTSELQSLMRS